MPTKFNQQGSLVMIIVMLMSFLLMSVTFLWRGIITMHDSAIARQQHMFKKIAMQDLLYYAIAQIQQQDILQREYSFERWPLHSKAQWYWLAKLKIDTTEQRVYINATLYDKERVTLRGSCKLTTTLENAECIWFIDAWTIE